MDGTLLEALGVLRDAFRRAEPTYAGFEVRLPPELFAALRLELSRTVAESMLVADGNADGNGVLLGDVRVSEAPGSGSTG